MKTVTQRLLSITSMIAFALLLVAGTATAKEKSKAQKMYEKQKTVVETAGPTDWKLLAKSARKLIAKETHLEEAKAWLDRSLKIFEAPYNLEVMGDYYALNGDKESAIAWYVKALNKGARYSGFNADVLQDKINSLRNKA